MKKNVGNVDMIMRYVLAIVLLICYFAFNLKDWLGLIVIILAAVLVITAVTKICPLYYLFGTDTLKKEDNKPQQ